MADQYYLPKPGLNHVGNYQVSGIPFVSGGITAPAIGSTALEIEFPSATQKIKILNTNTTVPLRVGFSSLGVTGSNYYLVQPTAAGNTNTVDLRVKTNKIFLLSNGAALTSNVFVEAELTGITGYDLAANYSGSVGIG